jgi:hypothetical protein
MLQCKALNYEFSVRFQKLLMFFPVIESVGIIALGTEYIFR